ncbi:MAG: M14 family metallopeptidase [Candidatus Pacebacteria bacterium]|nr:M14 family metallopeptidase [Candidatus Paceibacterota bacterium]
MKKTIIALIVIVIVFVGIYYFIKISSNDLVATNNQEVATTTVDVENGATSTKPIDKEKTIIGKSTEGRDIVAYHYGTGTTTELLFVGGIHGGYEWNTVLVAYEAMDYLKANPSIIPSNLKVTIIPVLNPDGLNKVVGTSDRFTKADVSTSQSVVTSGRFNANDVDLNRNFDCDWQSTGKWQSKTVSGGDEVFSESESQAIKNYVETNKLNAVVVWYSAAGGVYSSSCHNGILAETKTLTNTFAKASGYKAYDEFDSYEITGDMVNWFAKEKIPAISVLLTTHDDIEWTKNKAGIDALIKYYTK